ncbi:hypothetical protein AB0O39_31225 [Streptomyces anulatus]|uniref:hypothetical protein n=1 Tax=Streptomyces anulatus TaxID=1892 RepID=UPI001C6050B4|nr:hypothetical protein [Streptomyces anulatus]QYA98948.1 hypothetical protein KZO11_38060 [Streptomyces anulatus]
MPGGDISDLDKNCALVAWLRYQLRHAEQRVRDLEHAQETERRRRQQARAEQPWKIQPRRPPRPPCFTKVAAALQVPGVHRP